MPNDDKTPPEPRAKQVHADHAGVAKERESKAATAVPPQARRRQRSGGNLPGEWTLYGRRMFNMANVVFIELPNVADESPTVVFVFAANLRETLTGDDAKAFLDETGLKAVEGDFPPMEFSGSRPEISLSDRPFPQTVQTGESGRIFSLADLKSERENPEKVVNAPRGTRPFPVLPTTPFPLAPVPAPPKDEGPVSSPPKDDSGTVPAAVSESEEEGEVASEDGDHSEVASEDGDPPAIGETTSADKPKRTRKNRS